MVNFHKLRKTADENIRKLTQFGFAALISQLQSHEFISIQHEFRFEIEKLFMRKIILIVLKHMIYL